MIVWAKKINKSSQSYNLCMCFCFCLNSERRKGERKESQGGKKDKHCYFAERLMAWEELNSCTHHTYRNPLGPQNTEALTSCSSVQEEHRSWGQSIEGWPVSQGPQSCQLWVILTNFQMFMFKFIHLNFTCMIIWQYRTQKRSSDDRNSN